MFQKQIMTKQSMNPNLKSLVECRLCFISKVPKIFPPLPSSMLNMIIIVILAVIIKCFGY